jgi:hypothetical protein
MTIWLVLWMTVNGHHVMVQAPAVSKAQCEATARKFTAPWACATEEEAARSIVDDDCRLVSTKPNGTQFYICTGTP